MLDRLKHYLRRRFTFGQDPAKRIISFWEKGGTDFSYFSSADDPAWLDIFWKDGSVFLRLFNTLDLSRTLEIACGSGRHSFQVRDKFQELYLLDSSAGAIDLARARFTGREHVHFIHHPSGNGLPPSIPDNSLGSIFSYDAMVHFEKETIASYLQACFTKLRPGGHCLLHYSNYHLNPQGSFTRNPGWRNHMTQTIFNDYVRHSGLQLLETHIITFSAPDSDALSLLLKP